MKIHLAQPVSLFEAGKREVNEDFIYPLAGGAQATDKLFIICDGEGGTHSGDVASKLIALSIAKYLANTPPEGDPDAAYLDRAVSMVEEALSNLKDSFPDRREMASTLALMYIGPAFVTFAWIGNTRLYHYSHKQEKLFVTEDTLTPEGKPVLITGRDSHQKIQLHQIPLTEIGKYDTFLIASDGVTSQADDRTLESILKTAQPSVLDIALDEIRTHCHTFTEDNYACYLIQVDRVEQDVAAEEGDASGDPAADSPEERGVKVLRRIVFASLALLILCLVVLAALSLRKSPYDSYMRNAQLSMDTQNYPLALLQLDSARTAARSNQQSQAVEDMRTQAYRLLEGMDSLLLATPAKLIEMSQSAIARKDFLYADIVLHHADSTVQQSKDTALQRKLADIYLQFGNYLTGAEGGNDCVKATELYQAAFKIYAKPELATHKSRQLIATAEANQAACTQTLANANTQTRSVAPAEQPAKPAAKPAAGNLTALNQPQTATPAQPAAQPAPIPASANARTRSADPVTTAAPAPAASLTAAERKTLEARLKSGKSHFETASAANSTYSYKKALADLSAAEAVLDGPGAYMLAYLYHAGLGTSRDGAKALKYATISAKQNWAAGQYLAGYLLLQNNSSRDQANARIYIRQAAAQNFLPAVELLQKMN
ncbi:MAG: protein phosphatase 2C domain-containing protein [Bacteroidia bacterium]|nr:protein phosphatase 2C domain-containing protein [Bacteroidia bacterium]